MRDRDGNGRILGEARVQLAAELRAAYEQGAGIRALAETTGRSYGFVRDALNAAGATLRPRGRPQHATALRSTGSPDA